jgi:ferric-dicitrate binding protein FerR (iron transport regulator)
MDLKTVEKFFTNQATHEEARMILEWFETPEGKKYLQKRLDVDAGLMDRTELRSLVTGLNSEKLYSSIQNKIWISENRFFLKHTDWVGNIFKTAAAILVILTASLFTISQERYQASQVVVQKPVIYQSDENQQKEITLRDGSVIRLNNNSEMIVSKDFMQGTREVTLNGEAYFEVAHNPAQPFIIHSNQSSVEVLGTKFNLRSISDQDNVQLAVIEGKVSFENKVKATEENSAILTKGQFGYLDINEHKIQVDDLAVNNYLAWRTGRLNFEDLTMQQVCTQLNRIYDIECSFSGDEIRDLKLTANFSNESLEKTLEVVSLSLELDYERQDNIVKWTEKRSVDFNEVK